MNCKKTFFLFCALIITNCVHAKKNDKQNPDHLAHHIQQLTIGNTQRTFPTSQRTIIYTEHSHNYDAITHFYSNGDWEERRYVGSGGTLRSYNAQTGRTTTEAISRNYQQ